MSDVLGKQCCTGTMPGSPLPKHTVTVEPFPSLHYSPLPAVVWGLKENPDLFIHLPLMPVFMLNRSHWSRLLKYCTGVQLILLCATSTLVGCFYGRRRDQSEDIRAADAQYQPPLSWQIYILAGCTLHSISCHSSKTGRCFVGLM